VFHQGKIIDADQDKQWCEKAICRDLAAEPASSQMRPSS